LAFFLSSGLALRYGDFLPFLAYPAAVSSWLPDIFRLFSAPQPLRGALFSSGAIWCKIEVSKIPPAAERTDDAVAKR
jgi:hypothetical protein